MFANTTRPSRRVARNYFWLIPGWCPMTRLDIDVNEAYAVYAHAHAFSQTETFEKEYTLLAAQDAKLIPRAVIWTVGIMTSQGFSSGRAGRLKRWARRFGCGSAWRRFAHSTFTMLSRTYEAVPGFFIHDTPNVTVSQPIPPSFGLLDTSDDRWDTLFKRIAKLNHNADSKTSFKLFFLGRHGEGFHNVAEAKYGTPAWDAVYSKLDGDDEIVWGPDAEITPLGVSQAENAKAAWQTELANGLRIPDAMYVSPLSRALRTWEITFADDKRFKRAGRPMVMEACREQFGVHTCDQRRSKDFIGSTFREVVFEKGFTQDDELWTPDIREPSEHVAARVKTVIDHVFTHDKRTFISVTAHSGMINGFLASIGRPTFGLPTGGVLPVVVKATLTEECSE